MSLLLLLNIHTAMLELQLDTKNKLLLLLLLLLLLVLYSDYDFLAHQLCFQLLYFSKTGRVSMSVMRNSITMLLVQILEIVNIMCTLLKPAFNKL